MNIWEWIAGLFAPPKPGLERPSSPEIYRIPDHPWVKPTAAWTDAYGRKRLNKEMLTIPFSEHPEIWFAEVANTNSEDPIFDEGHGLECIKPVNEYDRIVLCDWLEDQWTKSGGMLAALVIYRAQDGNLISHRISGIKRDAQGRVWQLTGDNNAGIPDTYPVRDGQIHSIIGKIIY